MTKNPTILAIDSTGHFSSAGIFDKIGNEFLLTSYDCNFKDTNSELMSKSISSLVSGVINQNKKAKIHYLFLIKFSYIEMFLFLKDLLRQLVLH